MITKLFSLLISLLAATAGMAQVAYHAASSNIVIEGTSTLHDWEMKASNATISATFTFDATGKPIAVNALSFTMDPTALKSGKESMDDNAYKALKTGNHKIIRFTSNSGTITPTAGGNYIVKCTGIMTIAGASLNTEVIANCTPKPDGTMTCNGAKALKMTQYSMKPPTFMMGTIKTGDDINIKFNAVLRK